MRDKNGGTHHWGQYIKYIYPEVYGGAVKAVLPISSKQHWEDIKHLYAESTGILIRDTNYSVEYKPGLCHNVTCPDGECDPHTGACEKVETHDWRMDKVPMYIMDSKGDCYKLTGGTSIPRYQSLFKLEHKDGTYAYKTVMGWPDELQNMGCIFPTEERVSSYCNKMKVSIARKISAEEGITTNLINDQAERLGFIDRQEKESAKRKEQEAKLRNEQISQSVELTLRRLESLPLWLEEDLVPPLGREPMKYIK